MFSMNQINNKIKFNWPLIGNNHIVNFLSKSIINNKLTHAYIFFGPENLGKTTIANYFAQILLCKKKSEKNQTLPCKECLSCQQFNKQEKISKNNLIEFNSTHGDLHILKKEEDKKNISIKQMREFIKILSMSSFLGGYKIGIIKNAHQLSLGAVNTLLKTLEEPKKKTIIILNINNLESIPSTITSRAQIFNFYPVKTDIIYDYLIENHHTPRSQAKNLARLCLGRPALAIKFLQNNEYYQDYLEKSDIFLNSDFGNQQEKINKIFNSKENSQEAVKIAKKTLNIWQGLMRDLLLLEFGQENLIQHEVDIDKINNLAKNYNLKNNSKKIFDIFKTIEKSKHYLNSNVNPRLVLDNVIMQFFY